MKLVLREEEWEVARHLWEAAAALLAARPAYVEARSAFARANRAGRLSPSVLGRAKHELDERWQAVEIVEFDEELQLAAGRVAERFGLRAYDAVHLAAALEIEDPQLVVATWDRRLREAALDAGLAVAP